MKTLTKKQDQRRNYLVRRVRNFTIINPYERTVNVTDELVDSLTTTQKENLTELTAFGYSLQYSIPA